MVTLLEENSQTTPTEDRAPQGKGRAVGTKTTRPYMWDRRVGKVWEPHTGLDWNRWKEEKLYEKFHVDRKKGKRHESDNL